MKKGKMIFEELDEFKKDKKKLTKKYRTLLDDIETVKQVLEFMPKERPPFSFRISNPSIDSCIIKVKKIACKAMKGRGVNSGLRLVYAYFDGQSIPDGNARQEKIIFIELYHKSEKEGEDRDRILKYFK